MKIVSNVIEKFPLLKLNGFSFTDGRMHFWLVLHFNQFLVSMTKPPSDTNLGSLAKILEKHGNAW